MKVGMDDEGRQRIEEIEKTSRFPTGIGRIDRDECPLRCIQPIACMLCSYGHMLECHYPMNCEEVECSHYQASYLDE